MTDRPNVLLIVFDTARADGFSPYATHRSTPAVEQLASRGGAYANAFAPSCWTVPSHASMFLGAPPRSVGLSGAPDGKGALCAPVIAGQLDRWLPEVLRRAGYRTAGVSANDWISATNGFGQGFEVFEQTPERVRKLAKPGLKGRIDCYLDALRARADDGALTVERQLDVWLSRAKDGPFFWFVNLIECHSPYLPPKPFNDIGPLERIRAGDDYRRHQTLQAVLRAAATGVAAPERSLERMKHLYDRSIEYMDAWLARVLTALDRAGILDETIVIVTSDHGENFGECGLLGHAASLDDRLLRVPLVVAGPGVGTAPDGVESLCDLPRLIARLVGLDAHPWGDAAHPGIAVAQYDGPVRLDHPGARVLDEWGATAEGRRRLVQRFSAATDGSLKLVRSEDGDRLYDVTVDALERSPVDPATYERERVASLGRVLDDVGEQAWDPEPMEAPPASPDEVRALEERMKLLGYL